MHVSVTIVGFRNADDISECLDSLLTSTHRDFEVVVCENGGTAAYRDLQNKLPAELPGGQKVSIILATHNLGYAGGINTCIRATPDADAWWVLNPDTLVTPETMCKLVERLEVGDCEAVGSTVRLMDGKVQFYGGRWQAWLGRALAIGQGTEYCVRDKSEIEIQQNFLSGASMFVGRRFVEITGLMREDYFLYCEEVEWCLRARRRGAHLGFAPDAQVFHHNSKTMRSSGGSSKSNYLPAYLKERNRILLTGEYYPVLLPVVIAFTLPLLIYRAVVREGWHQFIFGIRGCLAGIVGKRGVPTWYA